MLWGELTGIALTLAHTQQGSLEYLRPDYFKHFSHYASRTADEKAVASLTERGREQVDRPDRLPLYAHSVGHLEQSRLHQVLSALKLAGWLEAGLPVSQLADAVTKRYGLNHDRADLHLSWLAKYDLVALRNTKAQIVE